MQLGLVLGLSLGIGVPVLVTAILLFVFSRVRAAARAAREALVHEGIVLDSGPRWITIHLNGYRAPGIAVGVGVEKVRAALVLTKKSLALIPRLRAMPRVDRADLARFVVKRGEDGALHIVSSDPPNASGTIDVRFSGADTDAWMTALVDAGARRA